MSRTGFAMVVRFPRTPTFDPSEDEEFRRELQSWCHGALREAGLGECEECAAEDVFFSAWCRVTEVEPACRVVVDALLAHGLEGMHVGVIPALPASPTVLWPDELRGHFFEL